MYNLWLEWVTKEEGRCVWSGRRILKPAVLVMNDPLDLHPIEPVNPAPHELLKLGLELGRMQTEVVHGADPQDTHARKPCAPPIHQVATDGAEAVLHGGARVDGLVLRPAGQFVLATDVREGTVVNGEVGAEHGGAEFVAVFAVADEGVDEVLTLDGLSGLSARS
jgi:hypothetical protein